jgi:hypothetical protein
MDIAGNLLAVLLLRGSPFCHLLRAAFSLKLCLFLEPGRGCGSRTDLWQESEQISSLLAVAHFVTLE